MISGISMNYKGYIYVFVFLADFNNISKIINLYSYIKQTHMSQKIVKMEKHVNYMLLFMDVHRP